MFQFTDLREILAQYLSPEQVGLVSKSYLLAAEAHKTQVRVTGEPYITHPVEVARILAGLKMDAETLSAAILHDVIEDTEFSKEDLEREFGEKVAHLVDGVSKLKQIKFESRKEEQAENFRKMMLAMSKDIRVILIKLSDRLHNMRTISVLQRPKQRRIARETLEIYAPIAHRLGMNNMRIEFEDLGFAALYPVRYRVLKEAVRKARGNRKKVLATIESSIQEKLQSSGMANVAVWGREKHLYSLYSKMLAKKLSFSEVMDVYAYRIIVESVGDCYRVLGLVHSLHKPVTTRFKDYIAIPKANGYQSLHTTLLGPYGVPIEVQIRTQDMENIAENGIASHWCYKSGVSESEAAQLRTREWLKGLLEIQKQTGNSLEFIENVKIDLYPDEVYVFTPKGRILSLPQGATPVDFAFLVHTDIGNACVACKIDRRLAPLSSRLASGQTVEIITADGAHPNPSWLSFAVTGKARSNIRHWLKNQQRSESQELGIRLLRNALSGHKVDFDQINESQKARLVKHLGVDSWDTLLEDLGLGRRMAPIVAQRLTEDHEFSEQDCESAPLLIKGTEGLVVSFAHCCYPIPGDLIVGHLVEGKGIVIHAEHCEKAKKLIKNPSKCINVQWEPDVQGEFYVEVLVDVHNQRGVLALLASAIFEANANIINVGVEEHDGQHNTVRFVISVRDRNHLARIMRRLRSLKEVSRIIRAK